jgi:hypothetical protein
MVETLMMVMKLTWTITTSFAQFAVTKSLSDLLTKKGSKYRTFYRRKLKRITMKVLKKVDTSNWSYKHTCATCESELQAEKGDIKYQYHNGLYSDSDYETWNAECPVCQNEFPIPDKELSKALKVEIRSGKLAYPGVSYVDQFADEQNKTSQSRD